MKKRFFFICLMMCLFTKQSFAELQIVYFGGGEAAAPNDRAFDESFQSVYKASIVRNTKADFYYLDSIAKGLPSDSKRSIKTFSQETFDTKIQQLKSDILNGKLKKEDQILLYFDTHARVSEKGEYQILADDKWVDPKAVQDLMNLAEKKGIKLGLVGETCFSGQLIKSFENRNICIITAAQSDKVGFKGDGNRFAKKLSENIGNTNLEEIYLKSRLEAKVTQNPSQPMISTPVGGLIHQWMKPINYSVTIDGDLTFELSKPICRNFDAGLSELKGRVEALNQTVATQMGNSKNEQKYKTQIQKIEKDIRTYQSLYDMLKMNSESKDELLKKMAILSGKIASSERELYDMAYRDLSDLVKGSNPCRDFKL